MNSVALGPAWVQSAFGESAYNFVKLLFSTPDSAEIGLYRSRLEAAGIECEMRNEHLSPAMPGAPFYPELWVLRDDQFDEARGLMAAWRQSVSAPDTGRQ